MKWEIKKLGDVCEVIAGQSPPSSSYNTDGNGIPFFQGKADFGIHYPKVRYWCNNPNKIAIPNDVLLSVRAPVGPTNLCNVRSCIGRGLASIRSNGKTVPKYIYYYFKFIESKLAITGNGSTFSAITVSDVKNINIPLPPIHVQQKIADILDEADALRRKDAELLAKYDELLQSIFYDMFGDPVKNEKGWMFNPLGKICTIRRGASPRPINDFIGSDIPWIKIGDGTKGNDIYIEQTRVKIKKEGVAKSVLLKSGSLIFANCGVSLGFARILKIDGCIHDGWLSFENLDKKINPIFLLKTINNLTIFLRSLAPEGTQPNLNTAIMKTVKIIVPPIVLQEKFATIVTNIEMQKTAIRRQKSHSEDMFQSLMHRAFKGELVV